MPTLTVSVVLIIVYYIALSASGVSSETTKPFYVFIVFFVFPILVVPLIIAGVFAAIRTGKARDQLARDLRDNGFHPVDRIDVPGGSLLIDRRQQLLCIAYDDTAVTGKAVFSTYIYSAKRLLACDVEQDAGVVSETSATTHTRTDRVRRAWFNDPNATVSQTTFTTTQTNVVRSLTLKVLVDDEQRPSHRIDFFRSAQGESAGSWQVQRRVDEVCTWEILIELLIAGQAIPAFGSLTELRDRVEVMNLTKAASVVGGVVSARAL